LIDKPYIEKLKKKLLRISKNKERYVGEVSELLNSMGLEVKSVVDERTQYIFKLVNGHRLILLSDDPKGKVSDIGEIRPNYYFMYKGSMSNFWMTDKIKQLPKELREHAFKKDNKF
jgi:hypothetical protein